MTIAAERPPEVARQRPHIGALAAIRLEVRKVHAGLDERQSVDMDRARSDGEGFAVARPVVGARAVDLDGRIGRRGLLDEAGEARQQRLDFRRAGRFSARATISPSASSVALSSPQRTRNR